MGSSITEAVPSLGKACAPCQGGLGHNMDARAGLGFFYLNLIVDIQQHRRMGVCERESADLAAALIRQAVLAEGCIAVRPLVLHADNGSP